MKTLSNREILDFLIEQFAVNSETELANRLGCKKQNLYQFGKNNISTINTRIISLLIQDIKTNNERG